MEPEKTQGRDDEQTRGLALVEVVGSTRSYVGCGSE